MSVQHRAWIIAAGGAPDRALAVLPVDAELQGPCITISCGSPDRALEALSVDAQQLEVEDVPHTT
jgi:hypothetical protein